MRSISSPRNVPLPHKIAKNRRSAFKKIKMAAPKIGLSIRQWSHDSPPWKNGVHHYTEQKGGVHHIYTDQKIIEWANQNTAIFRLYNNVK